MHSCFVDVSPFVDQQLNNLQMIVEAALVEWSKVVFEVGGGLRLFEEPPEKLHGKILNTKQKYEKMCDVLRTKLTWWWRRSN